MPSHHPFCCLTSDGVIHRDGPGFIEQQIKERILGNLVGLVVPGYFGITAESASIRLIRTNPEYLAAGLARVFAAVASLPHTPWLRVSGICVLLGANSSIDQQPWHTVRAQLHALGALGLITFVWDRKESWDPASLGLACAVVGREREARQTWKSEMISASILPLNDRPVQASAIP